MNLEEKLKKQQYKEIWQQYCGFLDDYKTYGYTHNHIHIHHP